MCVHVPPLSLVATPLVEAAATNMTVYVLNLLEYHTHMRVLRLVAVSLRLVAHSNLGLHEVGGQPCNRNPCNINQNACKVCCKHPRDCEHPK